MIPGIGTAFPGGIGSLGSQLGSTPAGSTKPASGSTFSDVFKSAVGNVDQAQSSADQQISDLLQGRGSVDVGQVTASVEKADIAFQLMMQVRNKVVNAYQDIEKMQF